MSCDLSREPAIATASIDKAETLLARSKLGYWPLQNSVDCALVVAVHPLVSVFFCPLREYLSHPRRLLFL